MLLPVTLRQPQFLILSLLRLLDKSVQQHHPAHPVDIKDHSRNSVLGQAGANLIEPATLRTANGHPDGPAQFHGKNVSADSLLVISRQAL